MSMNLHFNNNNKGNHIKKANQSKPQHTFNDFAKQNNSKIVEAEKNVPTTTMKVDFPTLHKISALQALLAKNTRTQTLHDLINTVVIPTLIKNGKVEKSSFEKVYSVEKLKNNK